MSVITLRCAECGAEFPEGIIHECPPRRRGIDSVPFDRPMQDARPSLTYFGTNGVNYRIDLGEGSPTNDEREDELLLALLRLIERRLHPLRTA